MTLELISAHEILFKGQAVAVTLPGELGSFTVLNNHAPIISVLVAGKVTVRIPLQRPHRGKVTYRTPDDAVKSIDIKGGIADVKDNVVSVCVY